MDRIYMDNSSTSYPKAPKVAEYMSTFISEVGCNIGRGIYSEALSAGMVVYETRECIGEMVNYKKPENVIFTMNITQSLNYIIKGYLKPGDHVLVSEMEHNAMMRPMVQMQKKGVSFDRIPCDEKGYVQVDAIAGMVKENTKAIFMLHASNVSGTIMDIESVGKVAKDLGLTFVVDAAQTMGVLPIDMEAMHIDILCFTGHKSLLGPHGVGGFVIRDEMVPHVDSFISGGTGSLSDSEEVPDLLPDRYEAGTQNIPAIYGLYASLMYLKEVKQEVVIAHERDMIARLQKGIESIAGVHVVGETNPYKRCPVLGIDFQGQDNADIGFALESEYGIMTRCGLHCAPNAHKTLGTFPQGVVRFSCGYATTEAEVDATIAAIKAICE